MNDFTDGADDPPRLRFPGRDVTALMEQLRGAEGFSRDDVIRFASLLSGVPKARIEELPPDVYDALHLELVSLFLAAARRHRLSLSMR